jgi:uncharacterized protein Yka (UPF0111/DUF47 family)
MRLRIFPREDSYFDLFNEVADNIVGAAGLLLDMVEHFVDPETKAERLLDAEHEGDRLTREIRTRLASTFITPSTARTSTRWRGNSTTCSMPWKPRPTCWSCTG